MTIDCVQNARQIKAQHIARSKIRTDRNEAESSRSAGIVMKMSVSVQDPVSYSLRLSTYDVNRPVLTMYVPSVVISEFVLEKPSEGQAVSLVPGNLNSRNILPSESTACFEEIVAQCCSNEAVADHDCTQSEDHRPLFVVKACQSTTIESVIRILPDLDLIELGKCRKKGAEITKMFVLRLAQE